MIRFGVAVFRRLICGAVFAESKSSLQHNHLLPVNGQRAHYYAPNHPD